MKNKNAKPLVDMYTDFIKAAMPLLSENDYNMVFLHLEHLRENVLPSMLSRSDYERLCEQIFSEEASE